MKRLVIAGIAVVALGAALAFAQTYTGPAEPTALVCAYNAVTPTPTAGKFFYIQCDSSGRIIVQ